MINDGRWRLWKVRAATLFKFLFFCAVVVTAFVLMPPDVTRRVQRKWDDFIRYVKTYHSPFYDFVTHKDMERAAKEYEEFKPPQSRNR